MLWRSSYKQLRYGGRSRLADREEPRVAVVRRRHQHHAMEAVSTPAASVFLTTGLRVVTFWLLAGASISAAAASVFLTTGRGDGTFRLASASISAADLNHALVGVVALRHVNEPPLPADDWQPYGSTCVVHQHQTCEGVARST